MEELYQYCFRGFNNNPRLRDQLHDTITSCNFLNSYLFSSKDAYYFLSAGQMERVVGGHAIRGRGLIEIPAEEFLRKLQTLHTELVKSALFHEGDLVTIVYREGDARDYPTTFKTSLEALQGKEVIISRVIPAQGDLTIYPKYNGDPFFYRIHNYPLFVHSSMFEESNRASVEIVNFIEVKNLPFLVE